MAGVREAQHHKILRAQRGGRLAGGRATLIVVPAGDAISFRNSDFEKELATLLKLLDGPDYENVVVDLGSANYFGSLVIGCITSLGRKAEEVGGKLALSDVSEEMRSVLGVTKLDQRWPILGSRRAALKAVRSRQEA